MIPPMSIESAYAACEQLCRQASSTFFASFAALPSEKRSAVHAVYAFCRRADDIADGDHLPESNPDAGLDAMVEARDEDLRSVHGVPPANPPEVHLRRLRALVDLRRSLRACLSDAPFQSNDPVMIALRDVLRRYPVRIEDLELIIDGMEDDLFPMRCSTLDDLRAYCYKVASAVGLVLIEIYGYEDGAARLHAIDMGIELQMINVLRDVKEDLNRDRVYLPHDLLSAHGIGMEDLASPDLAHEQRWTDFIEEYLTIVRRHKKSGRQMLPLLDARSRLQPKLMCEAYESILASLERNASSILDQGIHLSRWTKFRLALGMWTRRSLVAIRLA